MNYQLRLGISAIIILIIFWFILPQFGIYLNFSDMLFWGGLLSIPLGEILEYIFSFITDKWNSR
jgi:hypothetical protein